FLRQDGSEPARAQVTSERGRHAPALAGRPDWAGVEPPSWIVTAWTCWPRPARVRLARPADRPLPARCVRCPQLRRVPRGAPGSPDGGGNWSAATAGHRDWL